jgi:hypothetical protein
MNLSELKNEVALGLEEFEFIEKSAEEASAVTEGRVYSGQFNKPGLYRILSGPRGMIEEVEYIGPVDDFNVPSIDELVNTMAKLQQPGNQLEGDWSEEECREYIEEFYMAQEDEYNDGVLLFGWTEEEYDMFILVN